MKNKIQTNKILFILFFLFLINLFIIPNVLSDDIWINPFEVKEITKDVSFTASTNEQETFALINLNISNQTHKEFVRLNECKDIKNYLFCVKDIEFNYSNNRGIIYQYQYHLPAVLLNYSQQQSALNLKKEIKNDVVVNLKNKITVNLSNDGKKEAKNIIYNEIIPNDFIILSYSPKFKKNKNILTWQGNIKPNKQEDFYYEIMPTKEDNYQIKSNITYLSFDQEKEYISNLNINPKNSLLIEEEYSLNNQIGENITFYLDLKNEFDSEIEIISLNIITPSEIKNINWKGTINQNESKTFSINHYINKNIKGDIIIDINYNINNILLTYSNKFEINTIFKPLKILNNISDINLYPGNKTEIIIKIKNENNISNIENINCEVNAFNQKYNIDLNLLKPNNNFRIGSFIYTAPTTNIKLYNEIETICNYNLENIKYSNTNSDIIIVEPLRKKIDNNKIFESKVVVGDNLLKNKDENNDNYQNKTTKQEINISYQNKTNEKEEIKTEISEDKKKNWFTKLLYWLKIKK